MVKVNQIVRPSPRRAGQRLLAVLIAAGAATVLMDRPYQETVSLSAQHAPVLQIPVLYEFPPLRIVTADKQTFALEIFIEPETAADLPIIRRREPFIQKVLEQSAPGLTAREAASPRYRHVLKDLLLKQIRHAAAPAGIKNIYFNRIQP